MVDERLLKELSQQISTKKQTSLIEQQQCSTTTTTTTVDKVITMLRIESLLWGTEWESKLFWRAFDSMRITPKLQQLANEIQTKFFSTNDINNQRYSIVPLIIDQQQEQQRCKRFSISIHWRGGDFFISHSSITPTPKLLIDQSITTTTATSTTDDNDNDDCIFLMTNADQSMLTNLRQEFQQQQQQHRRLPLIVTLIDREPIRNLYSTAHGSLDPTLLLLQLEIATNATFFIGTEYSTVKNICLFLFED